MDVYAALGNIDDKGKEKRTIFGTTLGYHSFPCLQIGLFRSSVHTISQTMIRLFPKINELF